MQDNLTINSRLSAMRTALLLILGEKPIREYAHLVNSMEFDHRINFIPTHSEPIISVIDSMGSTIVVSMGSDTSSDICEPLLLNNPSMADCKL